MGFLDGKKVLVTGGAGFLGSHIVEILNERDCTCLAPRRVEVDFVNQAATFAYLEKVRPDVVIHCAAYYGGMVIHERHPAKIYYENLVMGAHLMEAAYRSSVGKFVTIGSDCAYPGYLQKEILTEDDLWSGIPHKTALDYGIVKRILSVGAWAYRKEYGLNSIYLIPTNMYGPRDNYDFESSHVVGALVRRFVEARTSNASTVEVWGSGAPTRSFLFVEDAAEGIILATDEYNDVAPMNLTTVNGNTIRELAETIKEVSGYHGKIVWNTSRPDGQLKKILDVAKMKRTLNWQPHYSLREGLKKTIDWYIKNKEIADAKKKV